MPVLKVRNWTQNLLDHELTFSDPIPFQAFSTRKIVLACSGVPRPFHSISLIGSSLQSSEASKADVRVSFL